MEGQEERVGMEKESTGIKINERNSKKGDGREERTEMDRMEGNINKGQKWITEDKNGQKGREWKQRIETRTKEKNGKKE